MNQSFQNLKLLESFVCSTCGEKHVVQPAVYSGPVSRTIAVVAKSRRKANYAKLSGKTNNRKGPGEAKT